MHTIKAVVAALLVMPAAMAGRTSENPDQSSINPDHDIAAPVEIAPVLTPGPDAALDAVTIPRMISYQGKLTDTLGIPVPDTAYQVRFRLYTQASGGTHFWEETQAVRTDEGLFSAPLGANTPIGSMPDAGMVYLGMRVGSDAEMTPRIRIVSAAYAFKADTANYASSASPAGTATGDLAGTYPGPTVDGLQNRPVSSAAPGNGQVLVWDGNQWMPAAVTPSGTAGGDLAGTYPNPIVDGLQGRAVASTAPGTNQVLKWTGSQWAPGNDSVGSGGSGDNAWVRGSPDSVLFTIRQLGIARGGSGNVLNGSGRWTHVNFGTECTTGTSGQTIEWATIGGGRWNAATDTGTTVAGGMTNQATAIGASIGGGVLNEASDDGATVGGGFRNDATGRYATIAGGISNSAEQEGATVGGGVNNQADWLYTTVGGGALNTSSRSFSTVGGGYGNSASDTSTVGGGARNHAWGTGSAVGGGTGNEATGDWSTISGGQDNTADTNYATVGGGSSNAAGNRYATVAGGYNNVAAEYGFIGGGSTNSIDSSFATIGGGSANQAIGRWSTVGGGYNNDAERYRSTVSGGGGNTAGNVYAAVGGGEYNSAGGSYSSIGGGYRNTAATAYSTVGGGDSNAVSGSCAVVAGGSHNQTTRAYSAIGGGRDNTVTFDYAVIAGGHRNSAYNNSSVGGGYANAASGQFAAVAGGAIDTAAGMYSFTTGYGSVVPSSYTSSAAFNGQRATASNQLRCGALSKASGSFTIDHPLDPYGKILNHYFIEGPEMLNIYRGSVTLDASGRAVVVLPDYFGALNRNPHVQLTGVGASAVIYVAEDVSGNRFTIGGPAGAKVYWQVTGERKDVSAEATRRMMPVEQRKTGDLAGCMLDDDFLAGCMAQLESEGKAQGIGFRTASGRQRYEKMKSLTEDR